MFYQRQTPREVVGQADPLSDLGMPVHAAACPMGLPKRRHIDAPARRSLRGDRWSIWTLLPQRSARFEDPTGNSAPNRRLATSRHARRIVRLGPPRAGPARRIELDPAERVPALHALLPWHPAELDFVDRSPSTGGAVVAVATAGPRYYDLQEGLLQACAPRLVGHPLWLVNSLHVPGRAWLYIGNGGDIGQAPGEGLAVGTDAWPLEHGEHGGAMGALSERETDEERARRALVWR